MLRTYPPNTYLAAFKRLNLLDHLTDAEQADFQHAARQTTIDFPVHVLNLLANGRALIWNFRRQGIKTLEPSAMASRLAELAHGRFIPAFEPASAPLTIHAAVDTANQQLAQTDSDARFYWLLYPDDGVDGPMRRWALIFLTYEQRHDPELQHMLRFDHAQLHTWMPRRIDDVFAHLKAIGLLDAYTDEQIATCRAQAESLTVPNSRAILICFPGLVCAFDTEYIYDDTEDYPRLVAHTAQYSRGIFTPRNIQCTAPAPDSYVTLSFDFDGQHFETTLRSASDWVNFDYLRWINSVLDQQGSRGGYHALPSDDQVAYLIFLTPDQLAAVLDKQWIALEPAYRTF